MSPVKEEISIKHFHILPVDYRLVKWIRTVGQSHPLFFLCLVSHDRPKFLAEQEPFLKYVVHFFNPNM